MGIGEETLKRQHQGVGEWPELAADSTGRCNSLMESFSRCIEVAWTFVEPSGNGVELGLRVGREVGSFWEVLSQKPVRVFVRAALPGMLGIAEVDLDVRCDSEALVASHLRAPIPSQRFIQFLRKLAGVSYESVDYSLRVLAGNLYQHHEPGLAFDECCNLTVGVAEQQIAFPVPGYCSILGRARAFTD